MSDVQVRFVFSKQSLKHWEESTASLSDALFDFVLVSAVMEDLTDALLRSFPTMDTSSGSLETDAAPAQLQPGSSTTVRLCSITTSGDGSFFDQMMQKWETASQLQTWSRLQRL